MFFLKVLNIMCKSVLEWLM